jgi:hypothetical protein
MNRVSVLLLALLGGHAVADTGDPQVRTDHPWYPGELAFSSFDRLFATQAELYRRVVGTAPESDEAKALAAWLWRNTHYFHGEEGLEDLWGEGFGKGPDVRTREYWTGLFAHGFGLCGTTHSQWTAEMEYLLGHGRARGVGVEGHNSFEVLLRGGPYGDGKWVLLDHDISTVIFDPEGKALLSISEVKADLARLTSRSFAPERQRGWLVAGLHPDDAAGVYSRFDVAEYLAGYAGPPPMVHLRRGETLRRYPAPGLADGKTFVFWGRNYNTRGIPGPERSRTWVNQPEKMHGSREGTPHIDGQARYANAVYTYRPDFAGGGYREGVIDEAQDHVTFEFYTPYIIGATPPDDDPWGIYKPGGKNGLVLRGKAACPVAVSVDQGKTWKACGAFRDGLDLTDAVKGFRQYFIRFGAGARALAGSGLTMTTVCQVNVATLPRLKDGGTSVTFAASGRALISAGPTLPQARAHLVEGELPSKQVTLELSSPRGEALVGITAAAHVASSNPPDPRVKYRIEYSVDAGKTWTPIVKDWTIPRRGVEPSDFWSQSFCYGRADLGGSSSRSVRVRFHNDGGKQFLRAEAHLEYAVRGGDATKVTFDWTDDAGAHRESRTFAGASPAPWSLKTGRNVVTRWVEFEPVAQ